MRKFILTLVAASFAVPLAAPAAADPPRWAQANGHRDDRRDYRADRRDDRRDYREERREDRRDYRRASAYDDRGRYATPRRVSRNDRVWRGNDGNYHCQRENGTTGVIIGAAGGALLGHTIDSRGDRTLGTVLGAALGGLVGRGIDLSDARCR